MVKTHRGTWLALGVVGAVLVAAVGWLTAASMARAGVSSLGIGSDTVEPGDSVTVAVSAEATDPGIGAFEILVVYDDSLVNATACTTILRANSVSACNKDYAADTVFLSAAFTEGQTGSLELGTITFLAGDDEGEAALDVTVQVLTDPEAAPISVTPGDGTITIAVPVVATPTPAPTEEATPTAAPTTPAAPPTTGGAPDSSGASGWLLAAVLGLGLAALGSAAWVTARRRQSL